jgi:hypothetical protein
MEWQRRRIFQENRNNLERDTHIGGNNLKRKQWWIAESKRIWKYILREIFMKMRKNLKRNGGVSDSFKIKNKTSSWDQLFSLKNYKQCLNNSV